MAKPKRHPNLIAAYIGLVATVISATAAIAPKLSCEGPQGQKTSIDHQDANSWTALYRAARSNSTAGVDALLAQGANPNVTDSHGWTPIFQAAKWGNARMAQDLIAKGAAVDVQSDMKETPLHYAAESGDVATMRTIAVGKDGTAVVNVNVEDAHGLRPLHYAARKGNVDAVKLLLSLGAVDAKDDEGRTAMDLAANGAVRDALKDAQPQKGHGNPLKIKIF